MPLATLGEIVDRALAGEPGFRAERRTGEERLVTIEGEHAAAVTVAGTFEGRPAQRDFGVVFLDDAYALTSGYCLAPDDFELFSATVRELARGDSHFLGVRRRRYDYLAPEGWRAERRGFDAEWRAPESAASITVWPAMPRGLVPASTVVAQAIAEAARAGDGLTRSPLRVASLRGEELVAGSRRMVVLEDDRYTYAARLDATTAQYAAAFGALVRSIQPIPRPARQPPVFPACVHAID